MEGTGKWNKLNRLAINIHLINSCLSDFSRFSILFLSVLASSIINYYSITLYLSLIFRSTLQGICKITDLYYPLHNNTNIKPKELPFVESAVYKLHTLYSIYSLSLRQL